MTLLTRLRFLLRNLFGGRRADRALDAELQSAVDLMTAEHEARGLDAEAARRAARLELGGTAQVQERVRAERLGYHLGTVSTDIRYAWRGLRRTPGFSVVAIATLALGIGSATAIYGLLRGVIMQPLPYADADRLVMLWGAAGDIGDDAWMSLREVAEYRKGLRGVSALSAFTRGPVNIAEGEPERIMSALVLPDFFSTLGTRASLGRTFDARDGGGDVERVLLSHGLWQRQFGGRRDVVGRTIRVNNQPAIVMGVLPETFRLPLDYHADRPVELFRLLVPRPRDWEPWGNRSFFVVARLAEGQSPASVTSELDPLHRVWAERDARFLLGALEARAALPIRQLLFRDLNRTLVILFGAVGLLLLIACTNVAHLMLARADARRREIVTQAALGASRLRMIRQQLIESGLIALSAAALGIACAHALIAGVLAFAPINAVRMRGVGIDADVLLFSACTAVVATLAVGMLPALGLSRAGWNHALAHARGEGAALGRGTRRALVAIEMALSVVLVLCASLLARSYGETLKVDLGFSPAHVLAARIDLTPADFPDAAAVTRFFDALHARLASLPDVQAVGAARILPLTDTIGQYTITIEGRVRQDGDDADWQIVTPGYLETMRIGLVRGRTIEPRDTADAPLVAVVNETMAARHWPGEDAIGKRFHLGTSDQPWIEIVGVARDVRHNAVIEARRAEMFLTHAQFPRAARTFPRYGMTIVARTTGDPAALAAPLRAEVRALDPRVPVSDIRPMDEVVHAALADRRFGAWLMAGFAAAAMLLAAIGLYGVVSYVAARRTREIGVRMALGAGGWHVAFLVVRDGLTTSVLGVAAGVLISAAVAGVLSSQLYGISPFDLATFAGVPAALCAVAAIASFLPARRAVRISPVAALRQD